MKIERYVAIGDSQTEGLHDYHPDGSLRGWADRFADALAARHPGLRYANLAVRGKHTADIRRHQLEPALALEPDLATLVTGANDVMRPGASFAAVEQDIEVMVSSLTSTGCRVMSCTFPLPATGVTRRLAPSLRELNHRIRAVAARHDVLLVDLEDVPMASDLRLWSPDRIHLNPAGHERLALAFQRVFEGAPDDEWKADLPPRKPPGALRAGASEASWVARFLLPKLYRNLRGISTGDGRVAKRPELRPVGPRKGEC